MTVRGLRRRRPVNFEEIDVLSHDHVPRQKVKEIFAVTGERDSRLGEDALDLIRALCLDFVIVFHRELLFGCCYEVSFFRNPFSPDLEGLRKKPSEWRDRSRPELPGIRACRSDEGAEAWPLREGRINCFWGPGRSGPTKQPEGVAKDKKRGNPILGRSFPEGPYIEHSVVREIVEAFLKAGNKVELQECQINSAALALFDDRIYYVEGHALHERSLLIDHSWNRYGDFHFDITAELALGRLFDGYLAAKVSAGSTWSWKTGI
jgi:hypothetical protein